MQEYNLRSPIVVQLELTTSCNHRCNYCYNADALVPKLERELSKKHFLDITQILVDNDVFHLTLTGGESFLRKDVTYDILSLAHANNMKLGVNSNLTVNLEERDFEKLAEFKTKVLTSMPSCKEEEYNRITAGKNYRRFIKNLETAVSHNLSISVNTVITQENKEDVYANGKFLSELGVKSYNATPMIPATAVHKPLAIEKQDVVKVLDDLLAAQEDFGLRVDLLEPLPLCILPAHKKYEQFTKRNCMAGKTTAYVSPYGDLRACGRLQGNAGNILTDSFEKVWTNALTAWKGNAYFPQECQSCGMKEACSGGCRVHAATVHGEINAKNPWANKPFSGGNIFGLLREIKFDPSATYAVNPNVLYREERPGTYTLYNSPTIIIVNADFFNLFKVLANEQRFNIDNLAKKYSLDTEKLKSICSLLITRKLIGVA